MQKFYLSLYNFIVLSFFFVNLPTLIFCSENSKNINIERRDTQTSSIGSNEDSNSRMPVSVTNFIAELSNTNRCGSIAPYRGVVTQQPENRPAVHLEQNEDPTSCLDRYRSLEVQKVSLPVKLCCIGVCLWGFSLGVNFAHQYPTYQNSRENFTNSTLVPTSFPTEFDASNSTELFPSNSTYNSLRGSHDKSE